MRHGGRKRGLNSATKRLIAGQLLGLLRAVGSLAPLTGGILAAEVPKVVCSLGSVVRTHEDGRCLVDRYTELCDALPELEVSSVVLIPTVLMSREEQPAS